MTAPWRKITRPGRSDSDHAPIALLLRQALIILVGSAVFSVDLNSNEVRLDREMSGNELILQRSECAILHSYWRQPFRMSITVKIHAELVGCHCPCFRSHGFPCHASKIQGPVGATSNWDFNIVAFILPSVRPDVVQNDTWLLKGLVLAFKSFRIEGLFSFSLMRTLTSLEHAECDLRYCGLDAVMNLDNRVRLKSRWISPGTAFLYFLALYVLSHSKLRGMSLLDVVFHSDFPHVCPVHDKLPWLAKSKDFLWAQLSAKGQQIWGPCEALKNPPWNLGQTSTILANLMWGFMRDLVLTLKLL